MTNLSQDEKELIFDYCVGICHADNAKAAQELISSNSQAAELQSLLKHGFSPLDSWQIEDCPNELAEKTIAQLKDASENGRMQLEQLLAHEQSRSSASRRTIWSFWGRRLAMAAAFMIIGSVVISGLKYARYRAWQTQCQAQLASIWQGISSYSNEHNGSMPAVAMPAGTPWWKVGYQGRENHSNTRGVWLLVRKGYVDASDFICPGSKSKSLKPVSLEQASLMNDFPDRRHIPYSLRLIHNKPMRVSTFGSRVIMSDLNPLFETLPSDFNQALKITLTDQLSRRNSINHQRKGQNVLFCDGKVIFVRGRRVGASDDDIFTLQGKSLYKGIEVPSCEADAFLAP